MSMRKFKGSVPFLDLKVQYSAIRGEIQAAMQRVIESQMFILGPEVTALEVEIAEYCKCTYGIGVSSGTDALLVSLMALGVQPGDEVITTPYSFFATAGSIARLGATPVFVDMDPATFNIDAGKIDAAVTLRTKVIMPVHLFGQMAEMDEVMAVANKHGLRVVEDAAQAIGAEYKGSRAGSTGDLGCFSFFPSKNLGAFGDGGMVTTNDSDLADRVRLLRNHGGRPKYVHGVVGGNFGPDYWLWAYPVTDRTPRETPYLQPVRCTLYPTRRIDEAFDCESDWLGSLLPSVATPAGMLPGIRTPRRRLSEQRAGSERLIGAANLP
jgi:dTDP-4-amino-4,6-dideoxygalactose transaminase